MSPNAIGSASERSSSRAGRSVTTSRPASCCIASRSSSRTRLRSRGSRLAAELRMAGQLVLEALAEQPLGRVAQASADGPPGHEPRQQRPDVGGLALVGEQREVDEFGARPLQPVGLGQRDPQARPQRVALRLQRRRALACSASERCAA